MALYCVSALAFVLVIGWLGRFFFIFCRHALNFLEALADRFYFTRDYRHFRPDKDQNEGKEEEYEGPEYSNQVFHDDMSRYLIGR